MNEDKLNRREVCSLLAAAPVTLGALAAEAAGERRQGRGKVLMPIGDATEVMDTLYPFFRLAEEGFQVVVAGPEARLYHGVMHEIPPDQNIPWDITREQPAYHIRATVAFRDVKPEDYVGLFLSGGRAPEYLRYNPDLMRLTRHFFQSVKPVAVVCHGVEIVAAAGVLKGRTMTTIAKCALDVTQFGGTYVDQPCVVDGNMVSARGWQDYQTDVMKQFIKKLHEVKLSESHAGETPKYGSMNPT